MNIFRLVQDGEVEALKAAPATLDVNQRDDYGRTALMLADTPDMVQALIERGADVNAQDSFGITVLMHAVQAPDKGLAIVKALIAHGADVTHHNPIIFAERKYLPILVQHGAIVNAQNRLGKTRLMVAAVSLDYFSAKFLLEHGADPNLRDDKGETALTIARKAEQRTALAAKTQAKLFVELLEHYGAIA